jgi:NAD(P)H-flavin reductase
MMARVSDVQVSGKRAEGGGRPVLLVTGSSGLIGSEMCTYSTGRRQVYTYLEGNRTGDHIVYYSDLRKMRQHYPSWNVSLSLHDTFSEIVAAWRGRGKA